VPKPGKQYEQSLGEVARASGAVLAPGRQALQGLVPPGPQVPAAAKQHYTGYIHSAALPQHGSITATAYTMHVLLAGGSDECVHVHFIYSVAGEPRCAAASPSNSMCVISHSTSCSIIQQPRATYLVGSAQQRQHQSPSPSQGVQCSC
jgi:hypothetical protein